MKLIRPVVLLALSFLPVTVFAQAAPWLNPWLYRNPITVTGASEPLSAFQVQVELDSSFDFSKAKPMGEDIRFTASDGTTLLPFWIEDWNPAEQKARLWVKVPSIPAAGTVLYLYYGNSAGTSASSGKDTFDFFDDFNGPSLGYFQLSAPETVLVKSQSWEETPPHTLSVVAANSGGYTYWGYYGLANDVGNDCKGIGLARSNDLSRWTKYSTPLITNGRWPSVLRISGTYYMVYTKDYCTSSSYLSLATSTDGINFREQKILVRKVDGELNQNPNLFFNPNDQRYYLYWFNGFGSVWKIKVRSASSISNLSDPSSEKTILTSTSTLAAPNMFYRSGTYFLSTEVLDANGLWNTRVYSSTSPTSGFTPLPGNPVMGNGSACMFQHVFNNVLHVYYCKLTGSTWTIEHRTASLSSQQQFPAGLSNGWNHQDGLWSATQDIQQDGTFGGVAIGQLQSNQILSTLFSGSDYIFEAYAKQLSGRVMGLGVRATGQNSFYSANLYNDLNSTSNLYLYGWEDSQATELGRSAAGSINRNTWYKLGVKTHGTSLTVYLNDQLQLTTSDSSLSSGAAALYGEDGTYAEFNDARVRKAATVQPETTVGSFTAAPPKLLGLVLNPASITGGLTSTGTVTLSGVAPAEGVRVSLSSSRSLASVPSSVTVGGGNSSATFTITTSGVSSSTSATISAAYSGTTKSATLSVVTPPRLSSISLSPSTVIGGASSTGNITLTSGALPPGAVVSLSSSNSSVATVPSSVTVSTATNSATFQISTAPVTSSRSVRITASYKGVSRYATLTVNPGATLKSLSLNPTRTVSGSSSQGTVTLNSAAGWGGVQVALSSSNSNVVSLPAAVTVAAGQTTATFNVTSVSVSTSQSVTITASLNGTNQGQQLTVDPAPSTGPPWYNPAWSFRAPLQVSGTGTALSGYQVAITLSSGFDFASANSDGLDVRITDSDGVTALPFWIESWNAGGQSARLWVRIPVLPAGGTTLYLYYGNGSASSVSNGDATFEFFDDFTASGINGSKWTVAGGTWSTTTDTQPNGSSGGVARGSTAAKQMLLSSYSGSDYVLEAYGRQQSGRVWGLGVRAQDVNNLYSLNQYEDLDATNNLYVYKWVNNPGTFDAVTLGSAAAGAVSGNTWYRLMVKAHGSALDVYQNGVLRLQLSDPQFASGRIALYGEQGTVASFDNVLVRKWAASEPTVSVGGGTVR